MNTSYDWITTAVFAGLLVLFLHRSDQETPPGDALWQYLAAAAGCGSANWLGNGGKDVAAIAVLLGVLAFIALVLKPWRSPG